MCDIINGFRLGPAFLAHGVATFSVMSIFNENDASHIITPMLIMEISTIVLAVLRANFFTPLMQLLTQASFAILFFISRIIISPRVHFEICSLMNSNLGEMENCMPKLIFYMSVLFGLFFHGLNLFCKYIDANMKSSFVLFFSLTDPTLTSNNLNFQQGLLSY